MKKVSIFTIPAHGHTNPLLPVARELVSRGNEVRFYSFDEFEVKVKSTGAKFISCTPYMPEITEDEVKNLKKVSTTEMTLQDIRLTLSMNDFLEKEFKEFKPDVVYSDSVCFWGKLNAWKFKVPLVVSTSTFAFNMLSSKYMKHSGAELFDMIAGLPKISKELKTLRPYGYEVKRALDLVQSDNSTDSIVYTSRRFQPYAESFSDHYAFVGPSVFTDAEPHKQKDRKLVYISMGTVINDRPDFYNNCIEALGDTEIDVIISCGNELDMKKIRTLPDNIKMYPRVDQLDVLSRADAFITHCGMNSVSESLYMATPMALYPQTSEQHAVAARTKEIGAGVMLRDDSAEGIKNAVTELLGNSSYAKAAKECSDDFRSCPGVKGAADFILGAPHKSEGTDVIKELNKLTGLFTFCYWAVIVALILLCGFFIGWNHFWIIGLCGGILSYPASQLAQKPLYNHIIKSIRKS